MRKNIDSVNNTFQPTVDSLGELSKLFAQRLKTLVGGQMEKILAFICLIVLSSATVFAGDIKLSGAAPELDAEQKFFVEEYMNAVNSDNLDKLKSLIHQKSLSCITEENKEFFDDQFSDQLKKNIPLDHNVYVKEVNPDDKLPFADYFSYPVHPTHLIQINYELGKNKEMNLMIFVVNQNERYLKVLPCPKPGFMKKYREKKARKKPAESDQKN